MSVNIKQFRDFALFVQSMVGKNRFLTDLENRIVRNKDNVKSNPIFIIGAPRTGSTLLLQLMLTKFNLSYLVNIQSLFYGAPVLVNSLIKYLNKSDNNNFNSEYGYVKGFFAPSESGKIFDNWFGKYDTTGGMSEQQKKYVRNSILALTGDGRKPFVSKNLQNSFRLYSINDIFPNALFIWIKRDVSYTAQSILAMRKELCGDLNSWAGITFPGYEKISDSTPFEQVVIQIAEIESYISGFVKKRNPNILEIRYHDLCNDWSKEMDRIKNAYSVCSGVDLKSKENIAEIKLKEDLTQLLNDDELSELEKTIENSNKQYLIFN